MSSNDIDIPYVSLIVVIVHFSLCEMFLRRINNTRFAKGFLKSAPVAVKLTSKYPNRSSITEIFYVIFIAIKLKPIVNF